MFDIKTNIGNFGDWNSLYQEMKYTNTNIVTVECSYCFQHIATLTLTLADAELLASEKLLDAELIKAIKNFVKAAKELL